MKAFYYLSQAQLAIKDYDAALKNALRAHELCAKTLDKSLAAVTNLVLSCKKERWEAMERRRIRQGAELENETLRLLEREKDEALAEVSDELERNDIVVEWDEKLAELKRIFEQARAADSKRRKVPDWAIDDITFGIMVDPVVVSSLITSQNSASSHGQYLVSPFSFLVPLLLTISIDENWQVI